MHNEFLLQSERQEFRNVLILASHNQVFNSQSEVCMNYYGDSL